MDILNCTLSGNSALNSAGGIANDSFQSGSVRLEINNSTLSGNSSGSGGGIYNSASSAASSRLKIQNSTLSGNRAGSSGGGIYNASANATVEIGGTIVNAGGIFRLTGAVISLGFNLSSDNGGGFLTNATDQINTDPLLDLLRDNGGPTWTHALLCGSPAIDKGTNFSASATDQRGLPRYFDRPQSANVIAGDGTDIGAFEVQELCHPFLSNFGIVSNRFGFDIHGESNQLIHIDASTNLSAWTALATNTLGSDLLRFNDPAAPDLPHRAYRARAQ
jgi:hypothetical protein